MTQDLWTPVETSGLPDDFDFTIAKAEFGYDAQYNNGEQILFMLESKELQVDGKNEGQPHRQYYSLGQAGAWETLDHGRTVVSQSSPPATGFNKQSAYWKFIQAAIDSGAASVIQSKGTPDNAGIWEGLTFRMKRTDVDYGGTIGVKNMLLPTNFGGESGKADAPVSASVAASQVAAPTEAPEGTNGATAGAVNILELKLVALAKTSPSHDSFIEAVMEKHPEAQNDEDLFSRVLDEGGIYASARS